MVVEEGRVAAVVTDRGRVLTGMVVNAGGVWAPALGRMVGVSVPIRPRRGLLVVTEGVPFRLRGTVIAAKYLMSKFGKETAIGTRAEDSSVSVGLVVAQAKSGNLIFGSSREFAGYDTRTTAASLGRVVEDALRTLPVLRRVRAIRAFAGLRPASADGLPIVGRAPGVEGFVIAGGHEGDGVALAPITGRLIADLVLGGEVAQELNALRYDRFS
jgi:sarcosine oxidase subunit beta